MPQSQSIKDLVQAAIEGEQSQSSLGTLVEDPQTALDEVWKVSLRICAWSDCS